VDLELTM